MIGKIKVIDNDLFDIASRIKGIDEEYFIVYSYKKKRYEVHHAGQRGNTLAFVVPYPKLDYRALAHARRTRREKAAGFIAEIERENERKDKSAREAAAKKIVSSFTSP